MNMTQYIDAEAVNKQISYARLIFNTNGNYLTSENISKKIIRIGRDPRNDIVIRDYTVSRMQCWIVKEKDRFILKNYSYINTTKLNGKTVKKSKEIRYGDVVKIGNITFTFDNVLEAS